MQILRLVASVCLLALLAACTRNPNAEKQKYFESGSHYLENGEFPEAVIQFSNAIRIDPGFAQAHFKLAESYLQEKRPADAYRELQRTIELDPGNNKASLSAVTFMIPCELPAQESEVDPTWLHRYVPRLREDTIKTKQFDCIKSIQWYIPDSRSRSTAPWNDAENPIPSAADSV